MKLAAKARKTANAGAKAKPIKARKGEKVAVVLSGGNPRIAKADGDAPVQAYIAGMPGWKRDLGSDLAASQLDLFVALAANAGERVRRRRAVEEQRHGAVGRGLRKCIVRKHLRHLGGAAHLKVRTAPKPSSSQIALRSLIGSLPVPPTLTARSKATNEPMAVPRA